MATTKDKTAKSKKSAKKRVATTASAAGTARAAPRASVAPRAKTAATASRATARKTEKANAPASEAMASKRSETPAGAMNLTDTQAVPATAPVNAKLADIARTNMNADLELACDLASAKSPMEAMRLGLAYWYDNIGVFRAQAQELRALSANLVTIANEPIRESASRT